MVGGETLGLDEKDIVETEFTLTRRVWRYINEAVLEAAAIVPYQAAR